MVQLFRTAVRVSNLSQPDISSCQSACLGMAFGDKPESIPVIRGELLAMRRPGEVAGSPELMGRWAKQRIERSRPDLTYQLDLDASLHDCIQWLKDGDFLITHGWFTPSGHVICLDQIESDTRNGSFRFSVKDPYGEFDFPKWRYLPTVNFYDGFYSSFGIYATCVGSLNTGHARQLYNRRELNTRQGGMWVHRFSKKL